MSLLILIPSVIHPPCLRPRHNANAGRYAINSQSKHPRGCGTRLLEYPRGVLYATHMIFVRVRGLGCILLDIRILCTSPIFRRTISDSHALFLRVFIFLLRVLVLSLRVFIIFLHMLVVFLHALILALTKTTLYVQCFPFCSPTCLI